MEQKKELPIPKQTAKEFLGKALKSNMIIDEDFIKFCIESCPEKDRKYNYYRLYELWQHHGNHYKIWGLAE